MSDLIGKDSKDRWYPNSIHSLKKHLLTYDVDSELCPDGKYVISNICYNMQYIEYLRKTLQDLNLSGVLSIQTTKSFIVIGVSIIEAIFYLICANNELENIIEWLEYKKLGTSKLNIEGKEFKSETVLYIKNNKIEHHSLSFDQMIKKIEKKKLLSQSNQFFKDLNHLRKLRNRIHLQEVGEIGKTDFDSFWSGEYKLCSINLRLLLIDVTFDGKDRNEDLFDFLKV